MNTNGNKYFDIDVQSISDNLDTLMTPQVVEYVSTQIKRENLGKLDREWWIDFFIGVSLWGVAAGVIRVSD